MHVGGMDGWRGMVSHPDWEAGKAYRAEGGWMESGDRILTIAEVAADLRCSKAHVYNAINGKVAGVSALPTITMGRRKLVRRRTLEGWKRANEKGPDGAMLRASLEVDSVDAPRSND